MTERRRNKIMGGGTEGFEQGADQTAQTPADQSTGDVDVNAENAAVGGDVNVGGSDEQGDGDTAGDGEASTDDAGSGDDAGAGNPSEND